MPELIATGTNTGESWRNTIREGETVLLGRSPRHGWSVPWDAMISREHANVTLNNQQLLVRCLDTARNPIYLNGVPHKEFSIGVGGEFRIGSTEFRLVDLASVTVDGVLEERVFRSEELRRFDFREADRRLESLAKLPSLIADSRSDEDFAAQLVTMMLQAMPRANAVAVIHYEGPIDPNRSEPAMMRFELREGEQGRFRPSRRLIKTSLERRETMLHVWTRTEDGEDSRFTASLDLDWAFATPILNASCKGWCLYVGGKFGKTASPHSVSAVDELHGDMRFAELMAQFVGAIRQVRMLERREAGLSQFFSPSVMEMLTDRQADEVLKPREAAVTVLFCDLRGFSKTAERAATGDLRNLLDRVGAALGVMTRAIIRHEGAIADFQGDSVLGFWGWPVPPEDGPLPACRAALEIREAFTLAQTDAKSPLHGFRVGVSVAHGPAIAGRIGTQEQSKVGVFGAVVNLGSRLDSLTKQLRVPLVIDEATANLIRGRLSPAEGRIRRLGKVRPYGIATALTVSELLPPHGPTSALTDEQIVTYEAAVDALHAGRWSEALDLLDRCAAKDLAKDFLRIYVAQNEYEPPRDWDGVISLATK